MVSSYELLSSIDMLVVVSVTFPPYPIWAAVVSVSSREFSAARKCVLKFAQFRCASDNFRHSL